MTGSPSKAASTADPVAARLRALYEGYYGLRAGGPDLLRALAALPGRQLDAFAGAVARHGKTGRILLMGNGGSFDNATLLAQAFRRRGLRARTPGFPEDHLLNAARRSYDVIFRVALQGEALGPADLVVALSGSGNSPNILAGLRHALGRGAAVWCLGGRDGGRMAGICGSGRSLVVANDCMEVIEDLHILAGLAAAEAAGGRAGPARAVARLERSCRAFAADNAAALGRMAAGILGTLEKRSRVFVLGLGVAANHFRADLLRGATNAVPVQGLSAPECFTLNSAQATANDDGLDFVLADGLAKHDPGPDDLALLIDRAGARGMLGHCRDILVESGTPTIGIGGRGVRLDMFREAERDCALSLLAHGTGCALRTHLHEAWRVRPLDLAPGRLAGARKLGRRECLRLEARLRREGTLARDELLSFCYGRPFAATPPAGWAQPRCFY